MGNKDACAFNLCVEGKLIFRFACVSWSKLGNTQFFIWWFFFTNDWKFQSNKNEPKKKWKPKKKRNDIVHLWVHKWFFNTHSWREKIILHPCEPTNVFSIHIGKEKKRNCTLMGPQMIF